MGHARLGLMAPLSGSAEMYGRQICHAAAIAVEEVNHSGGVLGQALELHIESDGSNAKNAVSAAMLLQQEHRCHGLIGNLLSNARSVVAQQVRVPYLNFACYEGSIQSPYFFHFAALPNQQVECMVPYLVQQHGARGFFIGTNVEWARGSIDVAQQALTRIGGTVVGEMYCPADQRDYRQLIDRVMQSGADFLLVYCTGFAQIALLQQCAEQGAKEQLAVAGGYFDEVLASHLSAAARDGIYSINSYFMSLNGEENRHFLEQAVQLNQGEPPWPRGKTIATHFGESTYTCVKAFANAANQAGSLEVRALLEALREVSVMGVHDRVSMSPSLQHVTISTYLARCQASGRFDILKPFAQILPQIPERYCITTVARGVGSAVTATEEMTLDELEVSDYQQVLNMVGDAVIVFNQEGVIYWANPLVNEVFGFKPVELQGRNMVNLLTPPRLRAEHREFYQTFIAASGDEAADRHISASEVLGYRKDGTEFPAQLYIGKRLIKGRWLLMATIKDLSALKRYEDHLHFQASHDYLTRLPNRLTLKQRLQKALDRARGTDHKVAILFIDLDNFKWVNDSYGHDTGDTLLKALAQRLSKIVRKGDIVARFGGDEFVIVCEGIHDSDEVIPIAEKVLECLHQPVAVKQSQYIATASVGIAISDAYQTSDDLLRDSDAAMYRAKDRGRDCWIFFDDKIHMSIRRKLDIAVSLHGALEKNEFSLKVQPIYDLKQKRIVGGELLLRWETNGEAVSPEEFIPVAETNGFIHAIGLWVLEQGCALNQRWRQWFDNGILEYLSVNLSSHQVSDPKLAANVQRLFHQYQCHPGSMLLEVTETALMADMKNALDTMVSLRKQGFNFALDDFGTGYSSFGQLVNLPVSVIKIDRCFVDPLGRDYSANTVVFAMISMGHQLGLSIIAEGVEEENHEMILSTMSCDKVQGYYYAKPLSVEAFEEQLKFQEHGFQGTVVPGQAWPPSSQPHLPNH